MKTVVSVLKPGYLVSLKTSVEGGVRYSRVELETERQTAAGGLHARWETTKDITDADDWSAASKARSAARSAVAAICCPSAFGLLCPAEKEGALYDAVNEARNIADRHNAASQVSRVEVYVMVGRIAQDDVEAARAIGSEMRGLLEAMQAGIRAADPEAIRKAASAARAVGAMLSPEVSGKVAEAIAQARSAARAIVRQLADSGEVAADVVASISTDRINAARFAFLDLDAGEAQTQAPAVAPAYDLVDEPPAGDSETDRRVKDLMAEGLSRRDAEQAVTALNAGSVTPLPFTTRNLEL